MVDLLSPTCEVVCAASADDPATIIAAVIAPVALHRDARRNL
jgi:hypothetical protein